MHMNILTNNCWLVQHRYAAKIGFIWKVETTRRTVSIGLIGAI